MQSKIIIKNKGVAIPLFLSIVLVCMLLFPQKSFSQNTSYKPAKVKGFGIVNDGTKYHTTFRQMLDNPILVPEEGGTVTSFQISFLPKGHDFCGPFTITGSNKLQGMALDWVQKHVQDDTLTARVFVESINIHKKDKDEVAGSIIFTASNR